MMMVSLLLRPWILIMESLHTELRTLADDLLVTAAGPDHLAKIVAATDATHEFLTDMGAQVATNDSLLFLLQQAHANKAQGS